MYHFSGRIIHCGADLCRLSGCQEKVENYRCVILEARLIGTMPSSQAVKKVIISLASSHRSMEIILIICSMSSGELHIVKLEKLSMSGQAQGIFGVQMMIMMVA